MNDPITWGIVAALVALVTWAAKGARDFGAIEAAAAEAKREAVTAKQEAGDFALGLAALSASFNLFQVQAAEKYITRDLLKEFEERLMISRRETTEAIRTDLQELRVRMEQLSRANGTNGRRTK